MRGADMYGANLRGADLTETDFSFSRLTQVNLSDATIVGTVFEQTMLPIGFEPPLTARLAAP